MVNLQHSKKKLRIKRSVYCNQCNQRNNFVVIKTLLIISELLSKTTK